MLLKKKADALRKSTGDTSLRTQAEIDHIPIGERLKIALIRPCESPFARWQLRSLADLAAPPVILMFAEPIVFFMSIYLTFVYSCAISDRVDERSLTWRGPQPPLPLLLRVPHRVRRRPWIFGRSCWYHFRIHHGVPSRSFFLTSVAHSRALLQIGLVIAMACM